MNTWITAFFFFLPAGVANMAPVFANKIPLLNKWETPLDFGARYKGSRLLGDNKRWRGLVFGVVLAAFVGYLEAQFLSKNTIFETVGLTVLVSAFMGFGALAGDAVESFFKRRAGVKPGQSWFPFDQIDYIIGGLVVAIPFVVPTDWPLFLTVFVLYFGLHLLVSYIAYLIGFKDKPI